MIDDIKTIVDLLLSLCDRGSEALGRRKSAGHVQTTVDRFKYVVEAHGLTLTQIPGLLPKELSLRFSQLKDDAAIADTLTPDLLAWVAHLFGVQQAWLEGGTQDVYAMIPQAYKNTNGFVEFLTRAGWWTQDLQMLVFTACKHLGDEDADGPMAIALARPFPALPESDILQFLPTVDQWEWQHPPCRHFVLSLAAQVLDVSGIPIRIFTVPNRTVEQIQDRLVVPRPRSLKGCRTQRDSLGMIFDLSANALSRFQ